jgi:hypothetical protein
MTRNSIGSKLDVIPTTHLVGDKEQCKEIVEGNFPT